jgi:geranylgeranyl diphosphate synthase, type II
MSRLGENHKQSLPSSWHKKKELFESWLKEWQMRGLPNIEGYKPLIDIMNYSYQSESKRFRPLLFLSCLESFKQPLINGKYVAMAIECIHTYSLIHDDLPCMDDDDYRRGKLSAHKRFSEELAVLSGDALLTFAFELMALSPSSNSAQMVSELAKASGMNGMVAGQMMDLVATGKQGDLKTLEDIHKHKTGALIAVSLKLGAIRANQHIEIQDKLYDFGIKLGLMFQIRDDILDVTGSTSLGKTIGKDADQGKLTYPALIGLENSQEYLNELSNDAKKDLIELNLGQSELNSIIAYLTFRTK